VGEGDDRVELSLNAAACAGDPEDRVGNGFHGRYVDADDVPEAHDVEVTTVPAGQHVHAAVLRVHQRVQRRRREHGPLALATPPDPDYPILMLLSPKGEAPVSVLTTLASTIRVR
jgi:hypothetical protein